MAKLLEFGVKFTSSVLLFMIACYGVYSHGVLYAVAPSIFIVLIWSYDWLKG